MWLCCFFIKTSLPVIIVKTDFIMSVSSSLDPSMLVHSWFVYLILFLTLVLFTFCLIGYFNLLSFIFNEFLKYGKTSLNPAEADRSCNVSSSPNQFLLRPNLIFSSAINFVLQIVFLPVPKK